MNKILFFLILCLSLSCTKFLDLSFPTFSQNIALTGLLHPDSTLKIRLTYSLPASDSASNYIGVDAREVYILENESKKIILKAMGNGYYQNSYKPLEGRLYKVFAIINESQTLEAVDSIPIVKTKLNAILTKENSNNPNDNPDILIDSEPTHGDFISWFSIYLKTYRNGVLYDSPQWIESKSPFLDLFNSNYDNISGNREYYLIARIKPEILRSIKVNCFIVNAIRDIKQKEESCYIQAFYASKNYDKYLKSAISSYQNNLVDNHGDLKNPFGEFLKTYSNVKNGLGIFAAYNSNKIILK